MKKANFTNIFFILSIIILLFGSGYKLGEYQTLQKTFQGVNFSKNQPSASQSKDMDYDLFWQVWNTVQTKYIDKNKVDLKKMFYGAIKGSVASIDDPYTFFLSPDENKQSKDDLGGKFEGIGAQLGLKENKIVVIAPLKKSPAEAAGIKAGDIITKVDNKSIKGHAITQVVSKIRGDKGTKVQLTIERNAKELVFTIVRDQIHVSSVELTYDKAQKCKKNCGLIAVLKLNQFGESTNDEWDKAVDEIGEKWRNKEIIGMVLDLRDNPGGYLESSVYLASEFLSSGKLIVKQESTNKTDRTYYSDRNGALQTIPMTILINKGSASASEILSGALRDHQRAKLIGEKSFGKGSVQEAIDLKNGAGLHVTVAKWILPKGDWINGKGIEPNIKIENTLKEGNTITRETDVQLEKALQVVSE